MGKCKNKCCPCCIKGESDDETETKDVEAPPEKKGALSKLNCCKKKDPSEDKDKDMERAAGKVSSFLLIIFILTIPYAKFTIKIPNGDRKNSYTLYVLVSGGS